jgi:hypothetical protein
MGSALAAIYSVSHNGAVTCIARCELASGCPAREVLLSPSEMLHKATIITLVDIFIFIK